MNLNYIFEPGSAKVYLSMACAESESNSQGQRVKAVAFL